MAWGYPSWGGAGAPDKVKKGPRKHLPPGAPEYRHKPRQPGFGPTGYGNVKRGPTGMNINRNKGSKRFDKIFDEKRVKGGEWHTYADGRKVFVKKEGDRTGDVIMGKPPWLKGKAKGDMVGRLVGEMRGKGGTIPRPGDKGRRNLPVTPGADSKALSEARVRQMRRARRERARRNKS